MGRYVVAQSCNYRLTSNRCLSRSASRVRAQGASLAPLPRCRNAAPLTSRIVAIMLPSLAPLPRCRNPAPLSPLCSHSTMLYQALLLSWCCKISQLRNWPPMRSTLPNIIHSSSSVSPLCSNTTYSTITTINRRNKRMSRRISLPLCMYLSYSNNRPFCSDAPVCLFFSFARYVTAAPALPCGAAAGSRTPKSLSHAKQASYA